MGARSRMGDKNWDVDEETREISKCKCGQGKIVEVELVASHEKVLRIERDSLGTRVECKNPECPSK